MYRGGRRKYESPDSYRGNTVYRGSEIPPPPSVTSTFKKNSVNTNNVIGQSSGSTSLGINYNNYSLPDGAKKLRTEEEYFEDDDEQPSGPSSFNKVTQDSDSEEDPLDKFMSDLEQTAKAEGPKTSQKSNTSQSKGSRVDIEEFDDEETYYKWLAENPNAGKELQYDSDDNPLVEYDEDGNPKAIIKPNVIEPLPKIDHSTINYTKFEKCFYVEHGDISSLSPVQVIDLQQKFDMKVSGAAVTKPVTSFGHFGFDETLLKAIRKSEFTSPTPIQSVCIPAILSGRDVIGIAHTGSGKTAAFVWPMLIHIKNQSILRKGDGPIALILSPTRELAIQTFGEVKKFGKAFNFKAICAYGGGSKWEQSKDFEAGAEIAVATPGRMIDMIKLKATNFTRVTYLVLDEADRMLDMGFEAQVRSICNNIRPDRQTLLFSATFKNKIEKLSRDILTDSIKIVQGSLGQASDNVTQIVKMFVAPSKFTKWDWLTNNLVEMCSAGSVLIFVTKKVNCEELSTRLTLNEFKNKCIHGDLGQFSRNEIFKEFQKQEFPILVATDVASRGLDIAHIRTVINYDLAKDIDTHTHRVGRTGRAGIKGTAYSLVTESDKEFVGHLVRNLEHADQEVPKGLLELAYKSSWFKSSRFKKNKHLVNAGLGYSDTGIESSEIRPAPSSRLSSIKVAYKNQFMNNFRKGSEETTPHQPLQSGSIILPKSSYNQMPPPPSQIDDNSVPAKKKRSRWN